MPERHPLKTLKLSRPILEADREISELEFLEPTSSLFDELEKAQEWNSHAKTRSKVVATGLVLLEHLTGLHSSTLQSMTFEDRASANEIAGEILGDRVDEGKE